MPFSLKTGKSLTYGIGKSLTWGIGETLTCFEVLTGTKNRKINEGNCKELNQHGVSPPENKRGAKPKPCASSFISRDVLLHKHFLHRAVRELHDVETLLECIDLCTSCSVNSNRSCIISCSYTIDERWVTRLSLCA